jgi:hypothetical protein
MILAGLSRDTVRLEEPLRGPGVQRPPTAATLRYVAAS